jgi:hypothetical protein
MALKSENLEKAQKPDGHGPALGTPTWMVYHVGVSSNGGSPKSIQIPWGSICFNPEKSSNFMHELGLGLRKLRSTYMDIHGPESVVF